MAVESKYKNPDLFIRQLKEKLLAALERAADNHNYYLRELRANTSRVTKGVDAVWGEQVNTWAKDIDDKVGANSLVLGVFDPGDTMILVGTVTKVVKNKDESSIVYYDRVETRRRDHD